MNISYGVFKEITDKFNFHRIIDDNYPQLKYDPNIHTYDVPCHIGQRKLLFSEIEFLSYVSQYVNLLECLIVYIGSAPGIHQKVLYKMFPGCKWLFYDPRPFDFSENENIIIKTGKNGFFQTSKLEEVLQIADNRKIIYITDIRRDVDAKTIMEDNIWQQEWGILMNAEFMQIKFRFPYTDCVNGICNDFPKAVDPDYDISKIENKINIINKKEINHTIYLYGDIYTQLDPPINSTETRLYVKKIKYYSQDELNSLNKKYNSNYQKTKLNSDNYFMKYYFVPEYENKLNYFNQNIRMRCFEYKDSKKLKEFVLGFDDSYSRVCEYNIIENYFTLWKKENYNFMSIVDELININQNKIVNSDKNIIICPIITMINKISSNKKNELHNVKFNKIANETCIKRKERMKEIIYVIQESFKNQLTILNYQKSEQVKIINNHVIVVNNKIIIKVNTDSIYFNELEYNKQILCDLV